MLIFQWEGKAVSANRRLCQGKTRWYPNPDYAAFKDGMAYSFMKGRPRTPLKYADVLIVYEIGARADHHNYEKPILDALQQARVIDNDKHFGWVRQAPPVIHGKGFPDKITIILTGEK